MNKQLIPVQNAWVKFTLSSGQERFGRVEATLPRKDGIQVKAMSRVTVRANIDRLVGGAGEETIIARVGEGIVTTIGSAESHKQVLENPDMISKTVLKKGLDAGTAFEILSIDIADVDIGDNIGANPDMVEGAKVDIFGQNLSEFERDIIHLINRKLDEVNFLARQRTVSRSFESTSSLDEKRALADQPVVSLAKTISITKYQGERNERYR